MEVWDVAEASCKAINRALDLWYKAIAGSGFTDRHAVEGIISEVAPLYNDSDAMGDCRLALLTALESEERRLDQVLPGADGKSVVAPAPPSASISEPVLLRSIGTTNIVAFGGMYYAIPQNLGPIDLNRETVIGRPGVQVADSLSNILSLVGGT
jgi:hypothetical protein